MKISINGKTIELFHGATLKHALLKTDEELYHGVIKGTYTIVDQEGNRTDISGAAGNGFSYRVEKNAD